MQAGGATKSVVGHRPDLGRGGRASVAAFQIGEGGQPLQLRFEYGPLLRREFVAQPK